MAIQHPTSPTTPSSPLRRSTRRLSDAPRPSSSPSTPKSSSRPPTTNSNSKSSNTTSPKSSPLVHDHARTSTARSKPTATPDKGNPRKREPPPSSPRASRAEKRRRVDAALVGGGPPAVAPSLPAPVHGHGHALRKRKTSGLVPIEVLPGPVPGSSKRRKENAYKSPGRANEEREGKELARPARVLGCENPPVLSAKVPPDEPSTRRRSLRLSFPFSPSPSKPRTTRSAPPTPNAVPTPKTLPLQTLTSPLTPLPQSPADTAPRKRGRPPKRSLAPLSRSRTLVTSPPRPPALSLPPIPRATSPHASPTSPTSQLSPPFLLPHQIHAPAPTKPSPLASPTPLRRSTRLSMSISASAVQVGDMTAGLRRPPTPRPPFEGAGGSQGRGIVRPPTPRPSFEAGPPPTNETVTKKAAHPLTIEVIADGPPTLLVTPVTRPLTPIPIPLTPASSSAAPAAGDTCPECDPPTPTFTAPTAPIDTPKTKTEPEPELEVRAEAEAGVESEGSGVLGPGSAGLVGPAVPPTTAGEAGVISPVVSTSPISSPPTPMSVQDVKVEGGEMPATPVLPPAALPMAAMRQVPNLQIEIPEAGVGDFGMEVREQQGTYQEQQGQQQLQDQGQHQHQEHQHMSPVASWEEPLRIEKDWTLWEVACRLRVWEIQRRYTPRTIRSVVAQEANDFYSTHGWRAPPHIHSHGHGLARSPGDEGQSSRTGSEEDWSEYESEFTDDDEDEDESSGSAGDEWGDDPDAEGEPDPEVFPGFDEDDPSFNAELSSPTRAFGVEDAGAVTGTGTGMMSAFYVPPSPVLDAMDGGLAEREGYGKDLANTIPSPETPGVGTGGYGGQGQMQVQIPEPLLPLPPPRLGSIRVHALRQMEIGLAPFVGRGTPMDKDRAEEWATGKVRIGSAAREEMRGRSRERSGWSGGGGGERWMGSGERRDPLVLPGDNTAPSPGLGTGGFSTDTGEWEAFLESLGHDGGASVVANANANASVTGGGVGGEMMDVDCLVGDGCAPVSMSMPMPMSMSMHQNELMGPGLGMNMNMNMNMSMVPTGPVGSGVGTGAGVDGMGMFGMGFGVGMGIGMAVGLGVGVGGAGIGWFGPEDGSQQQNQHQAQHQHQHPHQGQHQHQQHSHPHQHQHQHLHPHPHAHQLSPPVSPTSPVTPGFVLDGFDQPTSTLSFALG